MNILFHLPNRVLRKCFRDADLDRLCKSHEIILPADDEEASLRTAFEQAADEVDAIVTGWGTPPLTDDMLDRTPNLKVIVHSAGSLKSLLPETTWQRGLRVASANDALAVGVSETTLGMIIAGLKGFFPCSRMTRQGEWRPKSFAEQANVRELFGVTIGIVSASKVGRHVIRLLRNFEVEILVYDPFLGKDEATALGARWVELDELVRQSDVVSLHAPALPSTRHMLGKPHFRAMKNGAIFINTARGMIVDEAALVEELNTGRIAAFLDVTDPEPPAADHPFRTLPNVVLLPHIAGAVNNGCLRQGRSVVDQLLEFHDGKRMRGEVTVEMFPVMA